MTPTVWNLQPARQSPSGLFAGVHRGCKALGFDFCVDHRADDLPGHLAAACPKGIHVYFENVGGAVFDAVLPLLNAKARIVKVREDIVFGLENAPEAFIGLLEGKNFGKLVVQVAHE